MYLIYDKSDKKKFLIVDNYETAQIPDDWDCDIISGNKSDRGQIVASKAKGFPLVKKEKKVK